MIKTNSSKVTAVLRPRVGTSPFLEGLGTRLSAYHCFYLNKTKSRFDFGTMVSIAGFWYIWQAYLVSVYFIFLVFFFLFIFWNLDNLIFFHLESLNGGWPLKIFVILSFSSHYDMLILHGNGHHIINIFIWPCPPTKSDFVPTTIVQDIVNNVGGFGRWQRLSIKRHLLFLQVFGSKCRSTIENCSDYIAIARS